MQDVRKLLYVGPEELEARLAQLDESMAVTHGSHRVRTDVSIADMDWNHMDPHHREHIHRTYDHAVRLAAGPDFQLSLTKYGRWPLLLPVVDIRLAPGLFYQCVSVFSAVTILSVIRSIERDGATDHSIDWYIVSKPVWKFLHGWLNRRLARLNAVQNAEDEPIRQRRLALRRKGFSFKSDAPDFVVSSALTRQTLPPRLNRDATVILGEPSGEAALRAFSVEQLDFVYLRPSASEVKVWPAVCPHEGGPLGTAGQACAGERLKCPWHGLEFPAVTLTTAKPEGACQGARLRLDGERVHVAPGG